MAKHPYKLTTTLPNKFVGPVQEVTLPKPNAFGIDPPRSDVGQMVPNLAGQLLPQYLSKRDLLVEETPDYIQSAPTRSWAVGDLFADNTFGVSPPSQFLSTAPFVMYLMATLARSAYTPDGDAQAAIISVLGKGTVNSRIFDLTPNVQLEKWEIPGGNVIACFNGATNLFDLVSYAYPGAGDVGDFPLPVGIKMWRGMASVLHSLYTPLWNALAPIAAAGRPIILVGHSFGGVAANYFAYALNQTFAIANPTATDFPVKGVYSFGMPAAFFETSPRPAGWGLWLHNQVRIASDPVPFATRAAWNAARGTFGVAALDTYGRLGFYPADANAPTWRSDDLTNYGGFSVAGAKQAVKEIMTVWYRGFPTPGEVDPTAQRLKMLNNNHSVLNYVACAREDAINLADTPTFQFKRLDRANDFLYAVQG